METKTIEQIIENLKELGHKPKSIKYKKNDYRIEYDMIETNIETESDVVTFRIRLGFNTGNLPVTFNKDEADYLENKDIDDWSIYKYWLEFTYSPANIQDLEDFLTELLNKYN